MIKENFVFSRINNGIERKYYYKLIKSIRGNEDVFGIEVERVDIKGDIIIDSFKDSIELISPVEEKVKKLLKMLYDNQVSPIHLIDIIGPFADEYVNDFKEINFN
ncbi:DUF6514 family protein [Clostridium sp.]|uniref:DUF6514 family protein n=1 Tax=Clostridium sp. TaxID=1506 RepID=UPI0026DB40D5|nr:DUF6514 family protein [Clostridium sp.]MDO5038487.1 DUF6514 family protein [Clostridium sp.]